MTDRLEKPEEALFTCPFYQPVESVLEGVDGSCFNDVVQKPIPKTHDSLAEEVPSVT